MTIRSIRIDPFERTVEEFDITDKVNAPGTGYQKIQKAIGDRVFAPIIFEKERFVLYVDENGLNRAPHQQAWFTFAGANGNKPLTGKAILLGTKPNSGDEFSVPDALTVAEVMKRVNWEVSATVRKPSGEARIKTFDTMEEMSAYMASRNREPSPLGSMIVPEGMGRMSALK